MFSCEREDQVVWAVAVLQYGTQAQNCSLSLSLSLSLSAHRQQCLQKNNTARDANILHLLAIFSHALFDLQQAVNSRTA